MNGDGYSDVIIGAYLYDNGQADEGRAFVYHGSAGGLALSAGWTAESDQGGAEFGFSVGTTGDVNRDGHLDVLAMQEGTETNLSLLVGDGRGALRRVATQTASGWSSGGEIALLEVDGDGRLDAVTSGTQSGTGGVLHVFPGQSAGGLGSPWSVAVTSRPGAMAAADMDRDGRLDLVALVEGGIAVLLRDPQGGFAPEAHYSAASSPALAVDDLDADGYPDVLTGTVYYDGVVWMRRNAGDGTLLAPRVVPGTSWTTTFDLGDLDADGRADLVRLLLQRDLRAAHLHRPEE